MKKEERPAARLLIVDDHPGLLFALAETLSVRLPRLAVDTSSSSQEALEHIRANDYDAIVTDVMMPGLNGLELLSHTRDLRPDSPVILVTGTDDKQLTLRALRGGAYDLILKPVDPDYFVIAVKRAIERRRLQRQLAHHQDQLRRSAEELERMVVERTQELREAIRAKDEFLATVSHELRTPLTPILGWARLLRSPRLDDEAWKEAIDSIERNARAQSQLIDDLLDVSRIVTGKLRLDIQRLDLQPVLDGALEVVLPAARAKDIQIEQQADGGAGTIAGDPHRLRQIFWNLLSNAAKFTPPKGKIRVEVERVDENVRVRVRDTGCGINAELLPFVFDRFRQGRGPGSRTGLGLGLAIVRHLVELHGGSVEAASAGEGRGACFTVTLPRGLPPTASKSESAPIARNSHSDVPPPSQCLCGVHILILEDTSDTRRVLKTTLEIAGARVSAVGNSARALEIVENEQPDVILCDIGLGDDDDDGYAFVRKVRALPAERGGKVPAIALTALAKPEDRLHAHSAGFQLHLPKPGPANLPVIISRLFAQHTRYRSFDVDPFD